jgi:hypothetical protein
MNIHEERFPVIDRRRSRAKTNEIGMEVDRHIMSYPEHLCQTRDSSTALDQFALDVHALSEI